MDISLKCLPYGALPYNNIDLTSTMMVKLFSNIPYLPLLPQINPCDNLYAITLCGIPGIKIKGKTCILKSNTEKFRNDCITLDEVYNNPSAKNLEHYKFEPVFWDKYIQIIGKIKPKKTIINLLGPLSISQLLMKEDDEQFLADKLLRKLIIQAVCVKAMYAISKIREISPDTTPIIMLEEPLLYKLGDIKRECEAVTSDTIVNLYMKVFQKIKEYNGIVGVQSFSKCDWQVPIEAGADIISFDAYTNPNNLSIIPDKINNFLENGGKINWGIIPVQSETSLKAVTLDKIYNLFIKTVYALVDSGVNEKLAFNNSTVSVQGNLDNLPIIFAEKAFFLTSQLAKRVPFKE